MEYNVFSLMLPAQVSGREVFEFRPELVNDDDEEADDTEYAEEEDELPQEVTHCGHVYIKTPLYSSHTHTHSDSNNEYSMYSFTPCVVYCIEGRARHFVPSVTPKTRSPLNRWQV